MGQERERIEQMFKSGDREMVKLARIWCHKMKINYWVLVMPTFDFQGFSNNIRAGKIVKVISYSLEEPFLSKEDKLNSWGNLAAKVYEIKLDKKWNV